MEMHKTNLFNKIKKHWKEKKFIYVFTLAISFIIYLGFNRVYVQLSFWMVVFFVYIVINSTWHIGHEEAKKKYRIPSPTSEKILKKYGKIIEILSQITHHPLSLPKSLLPYPKNKIREALKDEIRLMELLIKANATESKEAIGKELNSLKAALFMLDKNFKDDKIAIEENKLFKKRVDELLNKQ